MPKILIAEDDSIVRTCLGIQLRKAGYETVWAEDAMSALLVCENDKPDLILLDLGLVGSDGFFVLENLKRLHVGAPIIVVSGRDPYLNESLARSLGAVAFLQKPVLGSDLLFAINCYLSPSGKTGTVLRRSG